MIYIIGFFVLILAILLVYFGQRSRIKLDADQRQKNKNVKGSKMSDKKSDNFIENDSKKIERINLKQVHESIKNASTVEVLNEIQYIPNGCSIFNVNSNPYWIGGACEILKLNDNQLILVESIELTSSRRCKVKLKGLIPFFYMPANDVIKVYRTNRIFIITNTSDIDNFLSNFYNFGDFYKSLENINYKEVNYKDDPEYFSNYEDYLKHEDEDFFNDDDDSSVSGDPYEDFCDSQKYENGIDYSGENPLSPFEYRFVRNWVEIEGVEGETDEDHIASKKVAGHMVINGPTFYKDGFIFTDKVNDSFSISDIVVGDKTIQGNNFMKLIKSISSEVTTSL
jgi:hypothetical protein